MRDLKADKEICDKACKGPWVVNEYWRIQNSETMASQRSICRAFNKNNAEFIAAAREGWPEAIDRAIKAEDKLEKLKEIYSLTSRKLLQDEKAALTEENDIQRASIQQLSRMVVGMQKVVDVAWSIPDTLDCFGLRCNCECDHRELCQALADLEVEKGLVMKWQRL